MNDISSAKIDWEAPFPDAGTRYIALQQQLAAVTEAQAHAVLLHHDKVAGLLTQRYMELLAKMGEIEKELTP